MKIDEEGVLLSVARNGPAMLHVRTLTIAVACIVLSLAGCGGDDRRGPDTFTTQILSDSSLDGDIEQTGPGTYVVTQGMSPTVQSVFSGIDPATGTEFRAFLDFPLTGPSGVPANAGIDSAFVEVYVDTLRSSTGSSLPLLVELVSFQPPSLIGTDFDRTAQPPLASVRLSPPISQADVGTYVPIDVTPLMIQAQRLGLSDLQLRIMEDLGPPITTLMEIDDTTGANRAARAPLLTVTYF